MGLSPVTKNAQGICLAVVGFRADDGASPTANGQPSQEASRQYIHHVLQYTVQQLQVTLLLGLDI